MQGAELRSEATRTTTASGVNPILSASNARLQTVPGGSNVVPMAELHDLATLYVRDRFGRREIGVDRRRCLELWLRHFSDSFGNRPLSHLGRSAVERWLAETTRLAPSTRRLAFNCVRGFFDWLVIEGRIPTNPAREVQAPKQPRHVPRATHKGDGQTLLQSLPDARARVIVLLEFGLGLRRVEVSRAMLGDYDPRARTLLVHGKGDHERTAVVPGVVAHAIDAYLAETGARSGPLLRSYTAPWKGLSPHTIGLLVARWMRDAGVKQPGIGGHALRHAFASELLDECGDLRIVQAALGHANISTTSTYVGAANQATMRAAMEARLVA